MLLWNDSVKYTPKLGATIIYPLFDSSLEIAEVDNEYLKAWEVLPSLRPTQWAYINKPKATPYVPKRR